MRFGLPQSLWPIPGYDILLSYAAAQRLFAARAEKEIVKVPTRPRGFSIIRDLGGMCLAQRLDYKAACDGRISWRAYFEKWGEPRP